MAQAHFLGIFRFRLTFWAFLGCGSLLGLFKTQAHFWAFQGSGSLLKPFKAQAQILSLLRIKLTFSLRPKFKLKKPLKAQKVSLSLEKLRK